MRNKNGFSLVEILVSLFVVSLTAVSISGLQKMVGDQNRNNFAHTAVVELTTEKFEEVMKLKTITKIDALDASTAIQTIGLTSFDLLWSVAPVIGGGDDIRTVGLNITWNDAIGDEQTLIYSEQISLAMLLDAYGDDTGDGFENTIDNLLNTNKVGYFEANMGYKNDAYIIYNSQLFHSTAVHSVGNGGGDARAIDPPITYDDYTVGQSVDENQTVNGDRIATVSAGWENLGRIDNADLASLFTD